jgi:cytidylate kinase
MSIVAISASYGAGGSRVAPAVAEHLGVPFLDRAIPMRVVADAGLGSEEHALEEHDRSASEGHDRGGWLERALRGFVGSDTGIPAPIPADAVSPEAFRLQSEEALLRQAASGSGVILGRGAVIVLKDDPSVLRIRLDGPPERRLEQAVRLAQIDHETARRAMHRLDRIHREWSKHFYGIDPSDPSLYHVVLDSTTLPLEQCTELIVMADQSLSAAEAASNR